MQRKVDIVKAKLKKFTVALFVILASILVIIFSEQASFAAVKSINICLEVIIPSTFIFMVISSYILSNGLYKIIFLPFFPILKRILKFDEKLISIFLLSLIGGYPVGIKLIRKEISENKNFHEIAAQYVPFCYCISPTFATTMLGIGLYHSIEAGLIIYFSNILSCFIIAIISCRIYRLNISLNKNLVSSPEKQSGLINAINESSISLFKMCTVIVFFNTVIAVLECFLTSIGGKLPIFLKPLLEISNILSLTSLPLSSLPLISSLASFGGICVILQCKALAGNDFSFKYFYISRLLASALAFFTTKIILQFWDISAKVQYGTGYYVFELSKNKIAVIFLLIMLMILIQKSEKNFKKG